MMGKGTEKIENYENARLVFMDIDNIHAVRDSMDRLMRLCNEDPESGNDDNFLARLADTGWLMHVRTILEAAVRMLDILQVLSGLVWSCLVLSGLVWSCLVLSGLVWSRPVLSDLSGLV
jgi:hypothetical protein